MIEWNVYVNGSYVGTVMEKRGGEGGDEYARCAALGAYSIPLGADFSVSPR